MKPHPYSNDLSKLQKDYESLIRRYGKEPQGAKWSDVETQERRMQVLTEIGDVRNAAILDFGCGTGHLRSFLDRVHGFRGKYVGYDLSESALSVARASYPDSQFEQRDILSEGVSGYFDWILVSGVFNDAVSDNWGLFTNLLATLWEHSKKGLAFNALSSYVDYTTADLWHMQPEKVFAFCKSELSPCVTLRHDYQLKSGVIPYEFTIYVYRCPA